MDQPDSLSGQQGPAATTPPVRPLSTVQSLADRLRNPWHIVAVVALLIVIAVVAKSLFGGVSFFVPKTSYEQVYTLVNDKISQHGAIVVNLPSGVSKSDAPAKVTFEPAIAGTWVSSNLSSAIVYKASDELVVGKHYEVSLATGDGVIKKDFQVDEDPAVINVFPDNKSEADPASAITVVFNRPMVPLTTLSELEGKDVPVSVEPATPGKFKWITTRTLQFIPQGTLFGSAHYTVTVRPDFVSMDGLTIPGKTYTFTTKQLRLDHMTDSQIVYNQPFNFYFNEPVDLQKTTSGISVTNASTNTPVPFIATYGTKTVWDSTSNSQKSIEDRSIVSIVPRDAQNGHSHVWDFSTQYHIVIATAYPVGGDIALSDGAGGHAAEAFVTTSNALKNLYVHSDKTELASESLFDPSGTVTFSFYDDINKGKSDIEAQGLKSIEYGKKCQGIDSDNPSDNCIQVEDHSQLIMTFDPAAYTPGEKVAVNFNKLINDAGYQINKDVLGTTLVVYPTLRITKVTPAAGDTNASINTLVLCSNAPLKALEAKDFYKNFSANKYLVFGRWDNAYQQTNNSYENPMPCAVGDYVNRIHYGLLPLESYTLQGAIEDVFGQHASVQASFNTQQAPKFYLRLQNMQKVYNVTTPEHTKLTYATENFDYVNVVVCKVTPDSMVKYLAAAPSGYDNTAGDSYACLSSVDRKIDLKGDQWVNQYFQINLKDYFDDPRGQYIVTMSHPQYRDADGSALYAHTYVSVTNLAVTDNRVKWSSYNFLPDVPNLTPADTRGSVYWLSRIHSLIPEAGANISVYQMLSSNTQTPVVALAKSGTTNASGFAEFPLIADVAGAAITSGEDTAVVSPWADTLSQGSWGSAYQDERVYLYTDRPIYRPGQQVFLKGLYRVNFDGIFSIFADNSVQVDVRDSKGNSVLSQKVPVSAYGTFSTSLTLPSDAPLGTYSISARNQWSSFEVQEYVGAAFETDTQTDKDEYIAGATANVGVTAKYYFGVPLSGGTLDYTITSQNFYFDRYTDEYFNFGSGWYDCYDCGYGDTYLKSGKATLDANGATKISVPLDFNTLYKGDDRNQSKIFVVHGTIKDKQGKSVSFQKSFIVHRGDYYLGAKADPSFASVKQPFTLRVKTVDVAGHALAKSGITIVINKVSWESNKRQEVDGGYYNRPQRVLTPVVTKHISTNFSGDYSEEMSLPNAGDYEIDASGTDGSGNTVQSGSEIYIYGQGTVDVQPTNNATLTMTAEKSDVKVGENAKFIIQNPYPHAKALISIERGRIFSYEVVDINQSIYEYSFPVTEDYAPNVYASVILLAPTPEVKFGQLQFTVDRKQKALTIDIKSDKHAYMPGEKVDLTVTTTDAQGRAVPADVSVSVADLSVLALKGNPKKDPLVFFYDGFPLSVSAETNIKNLLEETPIPTGTKGGDGGSPADLATRKRGEFKDTAFWQADVITNANGVAHVSFTLPDNLTKWQIESVGITKDTKVGVGYKELLAQKELMTVPIAPRFIVPGDEFMIGAKIFNQTQSSQSLTVSLESPTLQIVGNTNSHELIKAGDTKTVYFSVRAPIEKTDGKHTFTLSAKNSDYNDTVEQSIPITANATYESTATEGSTEAASTNEYLFLPSNVLPDRGGLTIKTSATLAVYLSDALKYLFSYPYGCSEQLATKLSAIAITKRALSVPNVGSKFTLPTVTFNGVDYTVDQAVSIGLGKIYDAQTTDGGFAYYKGLQSDPYLTMHVLGTLADLKQSGYTVRPDVIAAATQYLYSNVSVFTNRKDPDSIVLLAYTLSRVAGGSPLLGQVMGLATPHYLNDTASTNALGYLALYAAQSGASKSFKDQVFATLLNRVDIDSRGAYVKTNQDNIGWAYYETPQKNTALLIKALAADKRDYKETSNLVRWLVASRAADGSWGSTNTSVAAIDALSDYLTWKRETESNFTLTTELDRSKVSSTAFSKENILSTIETFLPISKIGLNKTHTLTFAKTKASSLPNAFYYDMSLKYYLPVDQIAPRDEGIAISREFYSLADTKNLHPLTSANVGDVVHGVLTIISPKERHLFAIEDYIPAGFELVNFNLATEDQTTETGALGVAPSKDASANIASVAGTEAGSFSVPSFLTSVGRMFSQGFGYFRSSTASEDALATPIVYQKFFPDFQELHDDRLFLFAQDVQAGTYTYDYYVRATTPGTFSHLPAVASDLYFPENFGRTAGSVFTVAQ